jgi:hypothetical protein
VQEKKNSEGSPPFGGRGAGKEEEAGSRKPEAGRQKTKVKRQKGQLAVGKKEYIIYESISDHSML